VPGILGATVLGNGEIALILDVKEMESLAFDYISIAKKFVEPSYVPVKTLETPKNTNTKNPEQISGEHLCFLVGNIEYAFNMQEIEEVCVWRKYASLPFSPVFIRGIINLRGKIIPVLELRTFFGLNFQKNNANSIVIVLQIKTKEKNRYLGVSVDSITEINAVHHGNIEPKPEIQNIKIQSCVQSVLDVKGKKVALLSADFFMFFLEQKWSVS
jgi:purine-binding chemotaxis protein CheW